jgi:predicted PurR-regulated permease PerM
MEKQEHLLSFEALTRIVIVGIIVLLGWKALSILPIILIALVLSAAFYPIIKTVQKKIKIPFILSIFLILIIPIIPFIVLGFIYIPKIINEVPFLLNSINNIISQSSFISSLLKDFNFISYLQTHLDYATATANITYIIFSVVTTIILTFFLMYDKERLSTLFLSTVPTKEKRELKELFDEIAFVTGKYIRGNVLISFICGVVIYIGLTLLNVPFALPLAIFAALFDLLPLVGQTIGSIPAIIIAFGVSPLTGILVIILHIIYQQVENNIISPMIYNKALNLYPSVILLSVLLGASLFGILGAFLSLPVAASIPSIIEYHKNYKNRYK